MRHLGLDLALSIKVLHFLVQCCTLLLGFAAWQLVLGEVVHQATHEIGGHSKVCRMQPTMRWADGFAGWPKAPAVFMMDKVKALDTALRAPSNRPPQNAGHAQLLA